ncbi:MAG: hypothetical protein ABIJ05_00375 [Patescibacteria group bacterium]
MGRKEVPSQNIEKKESIYAGTCDKCKKNVPPENNIVLIDLLRGKSYPFVKSRHLLETLDCQGSPSRAQYLPDQPKDNRGYEYHPELEEEYRAAFSIMQFAYKEDGPGDELIEKILPIIQVLISRNKTFKLTYKNSNISA